MITCRHRDFPRLDVKFVAIAGGTEDFCNLPNLNESPSPKSSEREMKIPNSELLRVAYCDGARYVTSMIIPVFPVITVEGTVRKTQMVTDRELEIMKILWARSRASVREVQEDLNRTRARSLTAPCRPCSTSWRRRRVWFDMSWRAERSSTFRRSRRNGRSGELTRRFVDRVFDGALDRVMVALLGSKSPTPEELDRLRAMIDEAQQQSFLKPDSDEELGAEDP